LELDVRLLVTLGGMAVSVISSFVVVKTKLQQVEKDINETFNRISGLDTRLDTNDKNTEVTKQRLGVLVSMMSPETMEKRHRETERMQVTLDTLVSDVSSLKKMHNGSHPVIKGGK
tara:strand:- start:68 stop:415 length:348 start_codon:yes stop_codon:yes gene_type:complete